MPENHRFEEMRGLPHKKDLRNLKIVNKKLDDGILALRKANKAKLKNIPDREVSPALAHAFRTGRFNRNLTVDERAIYRSVSDLTKVRTLPHSKLSQPVLGGSSGIVLSSVSDAQKRLLLALGEVKAGNTSDILRNELVFLADFLLKKKKISQTDYLALAKI